MKIPAAELNPKTKGAGDLKGKVGRKDTMMTNMVRNMSAMVIGACFLVVFSGCATQFYAGERLDSQQVAKLCESEISNLDIEAINGKPVGIFASEFEILPGEYELDVKTSVAPPGWIFSDSQPVRKKCHFTAKAGHLYYVLGKWSEVKDTTAPGFFSAEKGQGVWYPYVWDRTDINNRFVVSESDDDEAMMARWEAENIRGEQSVRQQDNFVQQDQSGVRDTSQGEVYCPACGQKNPASSKFCMKCGAELLTP
jgi:hypothetical protein